MNCSCHCCKNLHCDGYWTDRGRKGLAWIHPDRHQDFVYWIETNRLRLDQYEQDYKKSIRDFFDDVCR